MVKGCLYQPSTNLMNRNLIRIDVIRCASDLLLRIFQKLQFIILKLTLPRFEPRTNHVGTRDTNH